MTQYTALIVDDEPLAREGLALRLLDFKHIEVLGQCRNAREAQTFIAEKSPDIVFLDVEMPGKTGMEMIAEIESEHAPAFIFVTAYRQYAVDAFDAEAVDYLVKPVKIDRLSVAIDRVVDKLKAKRLAQDKQRLVQLVWETTGKNADDIEHLLEQSESPSSEYPEKIAIKDPGKQTKLINCEDIEWVEAAGDYMCVHAGGENFILRSTLKELEQQLNPALFQRIHRSTIVNIKRVSGLKSHSNGESFITLNSGTQFKVSRGYKKKVKDFI
jgi:two-component system LytT family response regulator